MQLSELPLRVLSAAVLMPVAVAAVVLGGWWFTVLVGVGGLAMAAEWSTLTRTEGRTREFALVGGLVLGVSGLTLAGQAGWAVLAVGLGCLASAILARRATPVLPGALGAAYVCLPVVALLWLRLATPNGLYAVLWLMAVVWATDIGAYAAGRAIGGPRLAPRISPNKTWAGLVGGVLSGAGVSAAAAPWSAHGTAALAALGALLALVAQVGDLAESGLKRHYGVKDSGRLIPGHGGMLDRVDSVVFASSALALLVWVQGYWQGGPPVWH